VANAHRRHADIRTFQTANLMKIRHTPKTKPILNIKSIAHYHNCDFFCNFAQILRIANGADAIAQK